MFLFLASLIIAVHSDIKIEFSWAFCISDNLCKHSLDVAIIHQLLVQFRLEVLLLKAAAYWVAGPVL